MEKSKMKLDRLLSSMGYGARREVEGMVYSERILLDGKTIDDAAIRVAVSPELAHRITVDGEPLDPVPGMVVMLHKPIGVTCSHKESGALIYDLLPPRWKRRDPAVSSIGRLDKETSGLLLLTDDGGFLHRVISPKKHVAKCYFVTLDRPLNGSERDVFMSGSLMLEREEKPLLPVEMQVLSTTTARVTLHEGRYHQVRRMFAAVGNHVTALHRESVGGLVLPASLSAGKHHLLTPNEMAQIFYALSATASVRG